MKRHVFHYSIAELVPDIDWSYLLHAWGINPGVKECTIANDVICDARKMLQQMQGRYSTHALFALCDAVGDGDNIIVEGIPGTFVMKDPNPACPPEARYKMFGPRHDFTTGLATGCNMVVLYSADGIHFTEHHIFEAEERYNNMYDSSCFR